MKTVALIPIKLNNERTPGKNTKRFADGTPLICLIQSTLLKCEEVDEIYVYCSQDRICDYIMDGINFLKREECFDSQNANVNEMFYAFSKSIPADIYVLAHATAPFQREESIDRGISAVKSGEYDSAIAVKRMQEFIWKNGNAINYDPKNIPRTQDLQPLFVETTGLYIFTKDVIENNRSRIGNRPYLLEVSAVEAVDINHPIDFEIADAIYTGMICGTDKAVLPLQNKYTNPIDNNIQNKRISNHMVQLLDCTLRDGGYCNHWEFGAENMKKIMKGLADAGIDMIECGYISKLEKAYDGRSIYPSVEEISANKHEGGGRKTIFVAMINYGEYDCTKLPKREAGMIDGIRLAFHKKDIKNAMKEAKQIKSKGYLLFVQPMVTLAYDDREFLALINECNYLRPYAFYIVDSFGAMKQRDLQRLFYMAERNLMSHIAIGFHSHNNMQMAFSNAQYFVNFRTTHRIIIDCSVYGMGRGAGNLHTELFADYLNDTIGTNYDASYLLNIIDEVLEPFYDKNNWGYSLPNYLSALHHTHPNYADYLNDKYALHIREMNAIFKMMDDEKRNDFDRAYIDELYFRYLSICARIQEGDSMGNEQAKNSGGGEYHDRVTIPYIIVFRKEEAA